MADEANAMQVILKEQSLQHEEAAKKLRNGLEYAAKFDFVGGGSTNILPNNLTGANMELKRISNAIELGLRSFLNLVLATFILIWMICHQRHLHKFLLCYKTLGLRRTPNFVKFL